MTKTIEVTICDKCGKEINGGYLPIDYKEKHYDLCENCADAFLNIEADVPVTTCCAPAPERKGIDWDEVDRILKNEAAGPGEPEKPEATKFDAGKAQALRDANWTIKKIAEEMHVSTATVCKHTHASVPRKKKPLEFGG